MSSPIVGLAVPPLGTAGDANEPIRRRQYFADFLNLIQQLNLLLQMQRALAYNSTDQTIGTGVWTALTFDTNAVDITGKQVDLWGVHSTVSNTSRFTANANGYYNITGQIGFRSSAAGTQRDIEVYVNGAVYTPRAVCVIPIGANVVGVTTQISIDLYLRSTDYVEFFVFQDTGGNLNTSAAVTWGSLTLLSRL